MIPRKENENRKIWIKSNAKTIYKSYLRRNVILGDLDTALEIADLMRGSCRDEDSVPLALHYRPPPHTVLLRELLATFGKAHI